MPRRSCGRAALVLALIGLAVQGQEAPKPAQGGAAASAEQLKFFESEVQPILKAHCHACHGHEVKIKAKLRLTSRENVLKGGVTGPAVDLKNPKDSLLLQAINYQDLQMPPKGKLPQAQINVLTRWVEMGVPFAPETSRATAKHGPPQVNAESMGFWSFRPVQRPPLPAVQRSAWVASPIDAFVLAKLEAAGLTPVGPARKSALLRRAYYDLIGLPPTPEEVEQFRTDESPEAYEKVLDRLLSSPHYGERWARHWLDLVRYAETNSFERDDPKPFAWRYRDYVIRSLNDDKPYDQFIREQLAGDELDPVTPETIIATGYYRLGLWDDEPVDPVQALYDDLDDIVATTGQAFLGLTINCARCHDHKIDPIPQKDYYRMLAFFHGFRRYGVRAKETVADASLRPIAVTVTDAERQAHQQEAAKYEKQLALLDRQLEQLENKARADFTEVEKEDFRAEQNRLPLVKKRVPQIITEKEYEKYEKLLKDREQLAKSPPRLLAQALCVKEIGPTPRPTFVLLRGNPQAKGDPVEPGFPSVLAPPEPALRQPRGEAQSSGRRLALADWIASPQNQLTARVMVNRIWQRHFGRGIVRSASNFGTQGSPPTHPELLDWLASEFVRGGWRLKALHKAIMLSSAYRLSSQADPKALAQDPENDLLWRFDMRRFDGEEIRDSILAVNGSLNRQKMGGPSIYPTIPKEVLAGQSRPGYGWPESLPEDQARRSIYIHVKRSLTVPLLASFDAPETDFSCPVRFATTQPTQALGMLNSKFLNDQARVFADHARQQAGDQPATQVSWVLRRTLQREPSPAEIERGVKLIAKLREEEHLEASEALRCFCLVALNLNEFLYLD